MRHRGFNYWGRISLKTEKNKSLQIRNSTAEFLIFTSQAGENTIEVRVEDETVWLTQKLIGVLFDVESHTVNYHLQEIFKSQELNEEATTRKFRVIQNEGGRRVERNVQFYNLDAIISVGYRVSSVKATQISFCYTWKYCSRSNYAKS